jgi:hypothetical protein
VTAKSQYNAHWKLEKLKASIPFALQLHWSEDPVRKWKVKLKSDAFSYISLGTKEGKKNLKSSAIKYRVASIRMCHMIQKIKEFNIKCHKPMRASFLSFSDSNESMKYRVASQGGRRGQKCYLDHTLSKAIPNLEILDSFWKSIYKFLIDTCKGKLLNLQMKRKSIFGRRIPVTVIRIQAHESVKTM